MLKLWGEVNDKVAILGGDKRNSTKILSKNAFLLLRVEDLAKRKKEETKRSEAVEIFFCTFVMNLIIWPLKNISSQRGSDEPLTSTAFAPARTDCKETSSS